MSTLTVGTIQSNTTSPPAVTNSGGTEIGTFCRAWVNFNGTGTVAIRAAFNVSSVTDGGVGIYTINFTDAFADVNYSSSVLAGTAGSTLTGDIGNLAATAPTSSALRITTRNTATGSPVDATYINVNVFR